VKKLIIILCSVAFIVSAAAVASAVPISGELFLTGFGFDSSFDAETATSLPMLNGFAWGTEDLISLTGGITTSAFAFSTPAANPLWTARGFSFILNTVGITVQEGNQLGLAGIGTLSSTISGLDDTNYSWDLNITDGEAMFSFSSSQGPAPVPEPATMLMMGTGLAGLAVVVRRRKVRKA